MSSRRIAKQMRRSIFNVYVGLGWALLAACASDEVSSTPPSDEASNSGSSRSHQCLEEARHRPDDDGDFVARPTVAALADTVALEASDDMLHPDQWLAANEGQIMKQVSQLEVGQVVDTSAATMQAFDSWLNLGMEHLGEQIFQVDTLMQAPLALVPTVSTSMPGVDCVVMSSIDRHNGSPPYVYETLRSTFAEFPHDVQINILVGNADVAYLRKSVLFQQGFSSAQIARIHIWPATAAQNQFLDKHFSADSPAMLGMRGGQASHIQRRASWNYVRALLSYRGNKRLLLIEDDITWAKNSVHHMGRLQAVDKTSVVSLFELNCRHSCAAPEAAPFVYRLAVDEENKFWCTQAMAFSAKVANPIGHYLALRMHESGYDQLISEFMHRHGMLVGYVHPSLVQHTGICSSGCSSWWPRAKCFRDRLPAVQSDERRDELNK